MPQTATNLMVVRAARGDDAVRIAALCGELGYVVGVKEVEARLRDRRQQSGGEVYVAEVPRAGVVGWVQIIPMQLLEIHLAGLPPQGEITGVIVDSRYRNLGIGSALMAAAEQWARETGLAVLRLRSRTERTEAHRFYRRLGYADDTTSHLFAKTIARSDA